MIKKKKKSVVCVLATLQLPLASFGFIFDLRRTSPFFFLSLIDLFIFFTKNLQWVATIAKSSLLSDCWDREICLDKLGNL